MWVTPETIERRLTHVKKMLNLFEVQLASKKSKEAFAATIQEVGSDKNAMAECGFPESEEYLFKDFLRSKLIEEITGIPKEKQHIISSFDFLHPTEKSVVDR